MTVAWRLANSLVTLRSQVNSAFPSRNKASDGTIGDAAHSARLSQHNPNPQGVVCAMDITEDLTVGLNCNRLMEELDASNDPRIFYIIHDRMIDNSDDSRTPYTGSNPHTKHLHISVKWDVPLLYDSAAVWNLPILGGVPAKPAPPAQPWLSLPNLTYGLDSAATKRWQAWFNYFPFKPALLPVITPLDTHFGPKTLRAVKQVQARYGLVADGIVGPRTKKLFWDLGWRG